MEIKRYAAIPAPKDMVSRKGEFELAEGPFYDKRYKRFSCIDITNGTLYFNGSEGRDLVKLNQLLGAAVPVKDSSAFVLAAADGIYAADKDGVRLLYDLTKDYKAWQRSNDAKCDSRGRLFIGSMSYDEGRGVGGDLYCFENGALRKVIENTGLANGMAWSGDDKRFFFSDSIEHAVFVYDYDIEKGKMHNGRKLFEIKDGVTDGMCIDDEDNLWVAIWGGRRVEKRDGRSGELLEVVEVDADNVSSCCFFGENMDTLFITTARNGEDVDNGGRLFTCKVDARGCDIDYAVL